MNIGTININTKLALAPMAGVTDIAFRAMCRQLGNPYTITEMVSAKALCYQDKKTLPLLELAEGEHPSAVQIFGSDLACMEDGAGIALEKSGAKIIDINMGCPVAKVAQNGDGSGLMRNPDLAYKVAEAVIRGAGGAPVTVKFRLGWDKGSINCVEFAKAMEQAGVSAIAVHGRTRSQMYSGTADWNWIKAVKDGVSIPVMANGDIFTPRDGVRILEVTGADMAMIGRGAFGNPWLFQQTQAALAGEEIPALPSLNDRCDVAMKQFHLAAAHKGEVIACLEARRHYPWYLKGVPHAGYYKSKLTAASTLAELEEITKGIKRDLG